MRAHSSEANTGLSIAVYVPTGEKGNEGGTRQRGQKENKTKPKESGAHGGNERHRTGGEGQPASGERATQQDQASHYASPADRKGRTQEQGAQAQRSKGQNNNAASNAKEPTRDRRGREQTISSSQLEKDVTGQSS